MKKEIKNVWAVVEGDPDLLSLDDDATYDQLPILIAVSHSDASHFIKNELKGNGKIVKRSAYVETDEEDGFGRVLFFDRYHLPYDFGPYDRQEIEERCGLEKLRQQGLAKLTDKEKKALGLK